MTKTYIKFEPLTPSSWFNNLFKDTHLSVSINMLSRIPTDFPIYAATEQILFNYPNAAWILRIRWSSATRRVLKPEIVNTEADDSIWLEWTNKLANHWSTEWLRLNLVPESPGLLPQKIPLDILPEHGTPRWIAEVQIMNEQTLDVASAIMEWICPVPDSPNMEIELINPPWSMDTSSVLDMLPIGTVLMNHDGVITKINNWLKNNESSLRNVQLPAHWETIFQHDWLMDAWFTLLEYKRASYITPWLHPYDKHTGLKHGPYTLSLTPAENGAMLQLTPLLDIDKIFYNENLDKLTGLQTRSSWLTSAQEELNNYHDNTYWLGLFGVDRLQSINDTLGHAAGDWILQEISARLKSKFPTAICARWTGDEYAVMSFGELPTNPFDEIFQKSFIYKSHELNMTCSAGVMTITPDRIDEISKLVQYTEWALRDAKENSKGKTIKAIATINDSRKHMFYIENGLFNAVKLKQFFLMFQPLIRLNDKKIIGAEALLRWQHPDIGIIQPQYFIPVAEQTGAIAPMTAWVLESACLDALTWSDNLEDKDFFLSVNLSPSQFYDKNLVADIHERLKALNFPAHCLKLEITEGVVLHDTEHNRETLDNLMRLGVALAIDDFGTGHASLTYLKNFPVQQLKIDKTFIQGINKPHNRLLTENIIRLAHNMNMLVVAEGVETEEQEKILVEMECDMAQGFRYGKPMPSADLKALLQIQKF